MRKKQKLKRDVFIIILSVLVGAFLLQANVVEDFLMKSRQMEYLGIFIAGMFFTSVFTTVPATVALGELALIVGMPELIFLGSLGALFGDFIIFKFFRNDIMEDFNYLLQINKPRSRLGHIFKSRIFKAFLTLVGGLIIASPLPDELGLALMGLSKASNFTFAVVSLLCNALGILIIASVARAIV